MEDAFLGDARWVSGGPYDFGTDDAGYYAPHRNHVLVGTVELDEGCVERMREAGATLRVAALGMFRAYVNGRRASEAELLGEWTNYTKLVYYRDLDVSDLLVPGTNVIAFEMGNGWYNPAPLTLFGKYDLRERLAEVGTPRLAAELRTAKAGRGGESLLCTDASWGWCEGQLLFNNVYLGEERDLSGFNPVLAASTEELRLKPVRVYDERRDLLPAPHPACVRAGLIEVVDIHEVVLADSSVALLADAGEMVTGFARLRGRSHASDVWTLSFAEGLGADGLPCLDSNLAGMVGLAIPGTGPKDGMLIPGGPGAPAIAAERDVVHCAEGETDFEGEFCVHSFRYVLIEDLTSLSLTYVHTGLEAAGSLDCGDDLLDRMADAALRTKLNNVHGIWEDCARERLGYGGDMVALCDSNLLAFDCEGLIRRTVRDFRNDQTMRGGVPETAPYMGIQSNGTGQGEGPLLWQLAYPYLLLKAHQYYGAQDLLAEEWPFVTRLVDYLLSWDAEELSTHCLGDHGSVATGENWKAGTPDKSFVGWCAVLWILQTACELAAAVGDGDVCERYCAARDELVVEVRRRFVHVDGSVGDGTQTSWAFAGFLEVIDAQAAGDALAREVRGADDVLTTGIFGTKMAFELLHHTGHDDVVEEWLRRDDWPSYQDMLADGSGALAEQFAKGIAGLGSLNHAMFSSYLQWLYQAVAGIEVAPDAVGADHLLLSPYLDVSSVGASVTYRTPAGEVSVRWERISGGEVRLKASWPSSVQVDFNLPAGWRVSECTCGEGSVVAVCSLSRT